MHEEPLKQLQAQPHGLKEICAAAASSVNGLDQAESRLAAIQTDVQLHLSELSRSLQALVAELAEAARRLRCRHRAPAAAWPLDRIVHLHDELQADGERSVSTRRMAIRTRRRRPASNRAPFRTVACH